MAEWPSRSEQPGQFWKVTTVELVAKMKCKINTTVYLPVVVSVRLRNIVDGRTQVAGVAVVMPTLVIIVAVVIHCKSTF